MPGTQRENHEPTARPKASSCAPGFRSSSRFEHGVEPESRFGLDPRRVTTSTTQADVWANLRALPFMYLVLPYVANIAQLAGWRRGRALR